ncbi:MAG: DUF115 domain-containing protein [Burkholderiales bacterium]|nr:DUF115 domain-containing protein [Burkholderiales bacterium]
MSASIAWPSVPVSVIVNGAPVPLVIDGACVLDNRERYAHCEAASAAGFPVLTGAGDRTFTAPCALVGSGLSAIALLPEIRARYQRGEEIIAIKGAHDWLIKNGIVPRAAIALDPQQSRSTCFRHPRREVLYLCASQMHPDTWEHLRGYQVLIWHSRIEAEQEKRPEWAKRFIVPCASTTGNSAILLMHLLGRRRFELYGLDSSLPRPSGWWQRATAKTAGRLLKLDGARALKSKRVFTVRVGEREYQTTAELAWQAQELEPLLRSLGAVSVRAHGDGYYQALLAEGRAKGWPV